MLIDRKKILAALLCFSASFIFCEKITFNPKTMLIEPEKKFNFSIEPLLGIRYGTIGEYVFFKTWATQKEYILSYLEWDTKGLIFSGAKLTRHWGNKSLSFFYKYYFPKSDCGNMQDNDWAQDYFYGNEENFTGPTTSEVQTNFSRHSNRLNEGYSIGTQFSFQLYRNNGFSINNLIALDLESISMTAFDGYLIYGNYYSAEFSVDKYYYPYQSENSYRQTCRGDGIQYIQNYIFSWLGFNLEYSPHKSTIGFSASFAPVSFAYAYDNHFFRKRKTKSFMLGYLKTYKLDLYYKYKFTERFALKADCSFLKSGIARGIRYSNDDYDVNKLYQHVGNTDMDGADTKYVEYTVSAIIKF